MPSGRRCFSKPGAWQATVRRQSAFGRMFQSHPNSTSDTDMSTPHPDSSNEHIAFIGGGNMASAVIGGLLKRGLPASQIQVVEPFAEQRAKLTQQFQVAVSEAPGASLNRATLVVWAVKPQTFKEAAGQTYVHTQAAALHLSVAAGIRSDSIASWLATQ